jgi:hypothetical protein
MYNLANWPIPPIKPDSRLRRLYFGNGNGSTDTPSSHQYTELLHSGVGATKFSVIALLVEHIANDMMSKQAFNLGSEDPHGVVTVRMASLSAAVS